MITVSTFRKIGLVVALLVILIGSFWAFVVSVNNGFVNWDDPEYILNNHSIRGLEPIYIKSIFTSFVNGNYQPLAILTFAVEYHFVKLFAPIYHLTNVILHVFNCLLVFFFIRLLSKNTFVALVTCILFGLHPTRVESVAWITERKDVLFMFFYMLAGISYLKYIDTGRIKQKFYHTTMILFLLSCFSKPAAVSFPLVLFLIDHYRKQWDKFFILEKIPFLLVSLIFGVVAIYGTRTPFEDFHPQMYTYSFLERIAMTGLSLFEYIKKFFWPINLSAYYPYPEKMSGGLTPFFYIYPGVMCIFLCGIAALRKKFPIIFFGTLFFICTIIFNLPLIAVGRTMMADRFTYLPFIGLFFIIAEGLRRFKDDLPKIGQIFLWVMIVGMALVLMNQTMARCMVWKNSYTLWSDVIKKHPNVAIAYSNRGNYAFHQHKLDEALKDYTKALELNPKYIATLNNRGNLYFVKGEYKNAFDDYSRVLQLKPGHIPAILNRAAYYLETRQFQKALKDYESILMRDSENSLALSGKKKAIESLNKTQ